MARKTRNDAPAQDSPFSFGGPAVRAPGQDAAGGVPGKGDDARGSFAPASLEGTVLAPGKRELDPGERLSRPRRGFGAGRDEASVYNDQMRERFAMDPRLRTCLILLAVAVVLIPIVLLLPVNLFSRAGFDSSLAQLNASFGGRMAAILQMASGTAAGRAMAVYFWQILAVALTGAALALNGAVYQGALNNALAAPSTLGVMSGATLGSVVYTLFVLLPKQETQEAFMRVSEITSYLDSLSPLEYFLTTQARVLSSLAGCAVVVALVLAVAYIAGRGRVSKVGLLISGQVFTAIITSIIEMVRYYLRDHGTDAQQQAMRVVVGGSFDDVTSWVQVLYIAVPVAAGVVIVMLLRSRLNLLSFDEDEARSMGLSVNATRNLVIIVCTVLTAVLVSFVGSVGFVGFLVPHLARKMVGPDFRYFIPASLALGAAYLLAAFYLMNASGVFQGSVGTFTSVIGVVFFAVMAIRQRARGNVDWI